MVIAYLIGCEELMVLEPFSIRRALPSQREAVAVLQRRALLANAGDRDVLLAHPDSSVIPLCQWESGLAYVAQRGSSIAGFAAILPRRDGDAVLDALFVEPHLWRQGIDWNFGNTFWLAHLV